MIKPILCPICQKPAVDSSTSPFCSQRCRKVDFFRWWDGRYAITQQLNADSDDVAAYLSAGLDPDDVMLGGPEEF